MDTPLCGFHDRRKVIDQARQNLLNHTSLTFLPRRQTRFLEDYSNLPGRESMPIRSRIKMISDDYRRKFLRRVEIAVQHSRQAQVDQVSEFNWEADAWRDVFGRLRDDERLRMDKREYNYKATVLNSLHTKNDQDAYMGKRIPDITFGLSSYTSGDPEDEGIDERERRIRRSFLRRSLIRSIWSPDGHSLIADGKWGKYTILFPFAVYEAKRNQNSEIGVKIQLKLALNTYLKMLDALVRQPENTKEYQSSRSNVFPIFGFTSSGSSWRVYVSYLPSCEKDDFRVEDDPLCDEDSRVKLIWWGDLCNRQDAGELLDFVDQIHEYAVTTHRSFVASHLQAWEKFIELHELHQELRRWRPSGLLPLPASEQDSDKLDWYSVKANGMSVRNLLREKRKRNAILTDDDIKRTTLETRLRERERGILGLTGSNTRQRGRPRKVQVTGKRKQPLRQCKLKLQNPLCYI